MIKSDVIIGKDTTIWHPELVNLYGCTIGDECSIGAFVEIGPYVIIEDRVRIGANCFIPEGVHIGNDCFIGPGTTFCNDKYPPSGRREWKLTWVGEHVSIGARAVILPGLNISSFVMIGAGSVVTKSIGQGLLIVGSPAVIIGMNPRYKPAISIPNLKGDESGSSF